MQEQIVAWLREHAQKHNLEMRALENCRNDLQMMLVEQAEETNRGLRGLALGEVKFAFVRHYLIFEDRERSWTRLMSYVIVGGHDEHCSHDINVFGYYTLETLLDGTVNDDWFAWEYPPQSWLAEDES